MKKALIIALVLALSGCVTVFASVPIRWTVETSRASPVHFDAYHGETLELSAAFKSYGNDLSAPAPASLHYQTNGMGASWWTAPATCASNTISATFTPDLDPGAGVLNCFLGGTASTYRAAFRLRFLNSPGATPNVLALPVTSYDARLYGTPTVNGTNLTEWVHARSQEETDPLAAGIATNVVTNVVTKSFVEALGITGGGGSGGGVDTNAVKDIINAETGGTNTLTHGGPYLATTGGTIANGDEPPVLTIGDGGVAGKIVLTGASSGVASIEINNGQYHGALTVGSGTDDPAVVTIGNETYGGILTVGGKNVATEDQVNALTATQATDHATISAWQTYWDGDDVRLTVTNYYGSTGMPHLYLEEKMATNDTHSSPWFKVVWDEMTRWTNFTAGYTTFTNNAIQNYADRAWGVYDSSTGEYSPEGVLQVSQPNILIAAGLAYQKTVAANGGAVWVLTATDPTIVGGQTENGFLNITDGDGNSLMRIVKGDRRTVGATATAIDVQSGAVKVAYSCVADEHPVLQASTNLTETFSTEASGTISVGGQSATVAWTGTSGAYTGTVTFASMPSSAFFRATYETGGETYISNSAPISVSSGILCTDGIHKCRPVYSNGSITWEVVQ